MAEKAHLRGGKFGSHIGLKLALQQDVDNFYSKAAPFAGANDNQGPVDRVLNRTGALDCKDALETPVDAGCDHALLEHGFGDHREAATRAV